MNVDLYDNCAFCNKDNLDIKLSISHKINEFIIHKYYGCSNCNKILQISILNKNSKIVEILCILNENKDILCGQSLSIVNDKFFVRKFLVDSFPEEKEIFIKELTENIAIEKFKDYYMNVLFI